MERVERYRNMSKLSLRPTRFVRRTAHFYCWECGQSSCQVHQWRHSINMETQLIRLTETQAKLCTSKKKWSVACVWYLLMHDWSERSPTADCRLVTARAAKAAKGHSCLSPDPLCEFLLGAADGPSHASQSASAALPAFIISPCHLRDPKSRASIAMLNGDVQEVRLRKNEKSWEC